jgi:hypothetical protein
MAKDKLSDYDGVTASNNTDIGGVSIAEGMLPSNVNNSMRELTKQLGAFADGTDGVDVLKLQDDTDTNSIKLQAPASVTANTTFTLPDGDGSANQVLKTDGSGQLGFADRHANPSLIINGAMTVAQRGTQTGQTGTVYTACDRFLTAEVGDTVTTSSQNTDVPSGQGFANSLKIDVTTPDASLAASDVFLVVTKLEGQDLQHLLYGTSDAKNLTLSFWVKSPKTGTHILELRQNDATYFNSQAYTIASANTWQKVELTFRGYTSTAFDDDNGYSLAITWFLAAGSDYSSGTLSSDTWHNTQANRAVGQVNCVDDAANNFYLTGVKLEVGSTATDFVHRSYGEELALCQRYFYRSQGTSAYTGHGMGANFDGNSSDLFVHFPVEMRANPSVSFSGTVGMHRGSSTNSNIINMTNAGNSKTVAFVRCDHGNVFSTGDAVYCINTNDASGEISFNAEL